MPYLVIENFNNGVDRRRTRLTTKPGALWTLENAFINQGGLIEKRKAFTTHSPGFTAPLGGPPVPFGQAELWEFSLTNSGSSATSVLNSKGAGITIRQGQIATPPASTLLRVMTGHQYGTNLFVVFYATNVTARYEPLYGAPGALASIAALAGTTGGSGGSRIFKDKAYFEYGTVLEFSAVGNPADYAAAGTGTIDTTHFDGVPDDLRAVIPYYDRLALLGGRTVQIWQMDADPANNALIQVIEGGGIYGPNAAARYDSGDVLFLSSTGIRSLRARDSSNFAQTGDVGSPIDTIVKEVLSSALALPLVETPSAVVDPDTGQFWLALEDHIFVLSRHPSSKVLAWSVYKGSPIATGVSGLTVIDNRVCYKNGNTYAFYGGNDNATYDTAAVLVETPMFDLGTPATDKNFTAIDVECSGTWIVYAAFDPANPTTYEQVATLTGGTFGLRRIEMSGLSTHIGLKFTNAVAEQAILGPITIHYQEGASS